MNVSERPKPLLSRVEYQSKRHQYVSLADWENEFMRKPLFSGAQSDLFFAYDENKTQVLLMQINLSNVLTEFDRRDAIRAVGTQIKTMKAYDHPNILKCHDAFQIDGLPVVVVPYYPPEQWPTVKKRATKNRDSLDISHLQRCARVGVQLSQVTQLFSEEGKGHRDLKSSNILCDEEGNIIVLDFGLFGELNVQVKAGVIEYRSPSHLLDDYITIEDEIYGSAVVVYELLTGEFPFDTEIMTHGYVEQRYVTIFNAEYDYSALYRVPFLSFDHAQELEDFFRKVFVKKRGDGVIDPMLFANNLIPALGLKKSIEELSAPKTSLIGQ